MMWLKKYIKDFTCLAEKCPDHCCHGWNIELDALDVHKLHLAGYGHIVSQGLGSQRKCQINASEGGCGGLVDGRCGIQNQCGHEAIPKICASYPRAFYRFSSKETPLEESKLHEEVSGFLSCPAVAQSVWCGVGKSREKVSETIPRLKLAEDFTSAGLYARKYTYIRNHIQILLQSNLGLAKKMAVVASAVRFSPAFFHYSSTRDETPRIVETLQKAINVVPEQNNYQKEKKVLFDLLFDVYHDPPPVNYQRSLEIHQKAIYWLGTSRDDWECLDEEVFSRHSENFLHLYEYDWLERPYMLQSNLVEHELSTQIRHNLLRLYLVSQPEEDISLLISSTERLMSHSRWSSDIISKILKRPLPIVEQLQSFYMS